ncbi:hypothetical protein M1D30_04475 [Prevotella sp. E15-22]|uniref:competence protein CoiA n=1 Tax=Prevotella sp. E15-22 TaxID=2937774 RepID=UPI002051A212|nr:competence protein CoiA family protein [Prevotella sp. E15-22]UPS45435.1 hypothetical protein M1D30_04475 [Prevotella sp. E15-22]
MKYAIVDNQKIEAKKGLKGLCPLCNQPVIAKCGQFKADHWAHKSCKHCDSWWENETEWHRQWKNLFPQEWQEVISYDEKTGEKHIADIKTNRNMVIEFQHSNISEAERTSREKFYEYMMWIVDGTRRKLDFKHFKDAFEYCVIWPTSPKSDIFVLECPERYLPKEWLNSNVPVIFDFKGLLAQDEDNYDNDPLREPLWSLLQFKGTNVKVLVCADRKKVIEMLQKGVLGFNYRNIANTVNQAINYKNRLWRYGY